MSFTIIWLQTAGCGGCTMSLLCAENPSLPQRMEDFSLSMLWHPALSAESGASAKETLSAAAEGRLAVDALCIEGAIVCGPQGTGKFHVLSGTGRPMLDWVRDIASHAKDVLAIGSCSAYGGVTAAGSNPTDATGLCHDGATPGGVLGSDFRAGSGRPVINIAGCPPHPDWITETLALLSMGRLRDEDLDELGRPRFFADSLVHHGCNRNEFYEFKASATALSEMGCMMEHLGCVGTQAHGDCNSRTWNGAGSCTNGGFPCINCTAPEFEEPGRAFTETPKIAGVPVGLPSDMPKAWFMALASLSKAATPKRLRDNATADRLITPPANGPASSR
ncbi:MAG: HupU protein [Rhodospirillaceae bacterium]